MSYISIIVPAFHLNTSDINDINNYCCSQFNITTDNFSLIEINDDNLKDNNIHYGIIFEESNLSLHKIEQLIYERNCIQNLSEKAFESLQLLSKKINDLENVINIIREEKSKTEEKINGEITVNDNIDNDGKINENNINNDMENDKNDKIEYSEKSIKKIKMEFNNMLNDIEILNTKVNNKEKYIQKEIIIDDNKEEKEINKNKGKLYSD